MRPHVPAMTMLAMLTVTCTLIPPSASAQTTSEPPTFSIQSLGPAADSGPFVSSINDTGTVAGSMVTREGAATRVQAFIQPRGGALRLLPRPDGTTGNTYATAINANNWVMGSADGLGPVVWTDTGEVLRLFPDSAQALRSAEGINDLNQVTGFTNTPTGRAGYVWDRAAGLTVLGDIPGGAGSVSPNDIGNGGHIVGDAYTNSSNSHLFLWTPAGGMRDLGDLPGGTVEASGFGVNDAGHITGYSIGPIGHVPIFWSEATGFVDIGRLPGHNVNTVAHDINNDDWVVGYTLASPDPQMRGFLWSSEFGLHDLNDLRDTASRDWLVIAANQVTDTGEILAHAYRGTERHVVLLTPVPEPTGMLQLLGIAACGAAYRLRRTSPK